jgi:predicted alpha/beta superfamily hydrolase
MTTSTTRRGAFGAAAFVGTAGLAMPRDPRPDVEAGTAWVMPSSTVVPLTSAMNGVDYALYVRTPVGYDEGDRRYPVIVTLDADYSFPIAAMQLEHLAARMNQGPEAILVSIGVAGIYPDVRGYRRERSRDYTPVFHPDGGYGPEFQLGSGGGPAFLRMLTEEALPLVASRWRADADDRTLVGHSYGPYSPPGCCRPIRRRSAVI